MNIKRFAALLLALTLALCLCACGSNATDEPTKATQATQAAPKETTGPVDPVDEGKAAYTVKVVDEGGNPIAGAMVQLCKESCLPGATNAEGVATFNVVEDPEYKVSFMAVPEGYDGAEEAYYFADGSYELTITLKAIA